MGKMAVSLVEERVLENLVRLDEPCVCVAEVKEDALVNISFLTIPVNLRLSHLETLLGVCDGWQRLVVNRDEVERFECREFVSRDYRGDRVSYKTDPLDAQRLLILGYR